MIQMRRPTTEQLDTAIAWLRSNEGDEGEQERCSIVADWIEHLERNAEIEQIARKNGVSVRDLKKRLANTNVK